MLSVPCQLPFALFYFCLLVVGFGAGLSLTFAALEISRLCLALTLQRTHFLHLTGSSQDRCSKGVILKGHGSNFQVSGRQVKVDQRERQPSSRPLSGKAAGRVHKSKSPQRQRVRNYNLKDDGDFR